MDQLFLMKRYWGSDEEDSKEEDSFNVSPKKIGGKQKSNVPLIDLNSDKAGVLPNKKQKLESHFEINNKRNKTDCSVSGSNIEIVNKIKSSDSLENINNEFLIGTINVPVKLKPKKLKDTKFQDNSITVAQEESDMPNLTVNNDHSVEDVKFNEHNLNKIIDVDTTINSKKEKKQRQRYFEFAENNNESISIEHNLLNGMTNNASISKDKLTKSHLQENDYKEVKSKTIKKSKLKEEVGNSDVNTPWQDHGSDIVPNKEKKKGQRYFDVKEIDGKLTSVRQDQQNEKAGNTFISKGKIIDGDNKIKAKNLKRKLEEIDDSDVINSLKDNNMNSQEAGNIGKAFPTIGQLHQQKDEKVKHTLPNWFSNPTYISVNLQEKETPVSELNYLDLDTKNNLIQSGINFLFPVQLAVIPWLMQSKEQSLLVRPSDICVSAPTGSGKTLAFVLPIVQSLKDRVVCGIRALVVLPVSELAFQVYKVFQTYVKGTDLKVALLTGKKSFTAEQNVLVKSTSRSVLSLVDIVVATPGRIHDHIFRTQGFCLKRLRYLVIDEADRMMEEIQQGWLKQVEDAIFRNDCISPNCVCSSYKRTFFEPTSAYNFGFISQPLQKLLYSATLTHDPEQLHTLSLYKPKLFTASSVSSEEVYKGSCAVPSGLKMLQVICEEGIKPMVICHLIKQHNFKRVLCFTETVERAHRLHLVLEEMGLLKVREVSSFNRAIQRKIVLNQFKSGKIDILVCSDLVARGIDIENIDCVISYDIPQYVKIYIHRIGRTARAGKTGTAIALLSEGETTRFRRMLNAAEIEIPEKNCVSSEDLQPFIKPFQDALSVADAKLKKEKNQFPRRSNSPRRKMSKKTRRKK